MYFSVVIDYVDNSWRSATRGVKQGRVGKKSYCRAKYVNISKTVIDMCKVTISD